MAKLKKIVEQNKDAITNQLIEKGLVPLDQKERLENVQDVYAQKNESREGLLDQQVTVKHLLSNKGGFSFLTTTGLEKVALDLNTEVRFVSYSDRHAEKKNPFRVFLLTPYDSSKKTTEEVMSSLMGPMSVAPSANHYWGILDAYFSEQILYEAARDVEHVKYHGITTGIYKDTFLIGVFGISTYKELLEAIRRTVNKKLGVNAFGFVGGSTSLQGR